MESFVRLTRSLLCREQLIPSCRLQVFITVSLLAGLTDLTKEVLLRGNGAGLAHSWHAFLMLMAIVEFTQHLSWYRQMLPLIGLRGITPLARLLEARPDEKVNIAIVSIAPVLGNIRRRQPRCGSVWKDLSETFSIYLRLLETGKPTKELDDSELQGVCAQGMVVNSLQMLLGICTRSLTHNYHLAMVPISCVQLLLYYISWQSHAALHKMVTVTDWSLMIESRFVESSCVLFFSNMYIFAVKVIFIIGESLLPVVQLAMCLSNSELKDSSLTSRMILEAVLGKSYNLAFVIPMLAQWYSIWRFMLGSGLCKVGGNGWRTRTALSARAHYVNQPLPSWTAWFTILFPEFIAKRSVDAAFVIEIICPFFVFGPVGLLFLFWTLLDHCCSLATPLHTHPRLDTLEGRFVDAFLERSNAPYEDGVNSRLRDITFAAFLVVVNALICPAWINKGFRVLAGLTFLVLMILINATGNFGNLGMYTAAVCVVLWAPFTSSHGTAMEPIVESKLVLAIAFALLVSLPALYVHVGLSMDALNSSITKFEHWSTFPALQRMKEKVSSRKRSAQDGEQTLQQELKRRRITASPNKPFSSVSDKGRIELIFEVKGGRPPRCPDGHTLPFDPCAWRRVPFYFKPNDVAVSLPWLFFFPGCNYWPRFDWISFFWRQFGSSHAKERSLRAFMQKLWVDDPVLEQLLPPERPRAYAGETFADIRVVRCKACFGTQWGCMEICMPSEEWSADMMTLTNREKREAVLAKEVARDASLDTVQKSSQGFFHYAGGYRCYGNVGALIGNAMLMAYIWLIFLA